MSNKWSYKCEDSFLYFSIFVVFHIFLYFVVLKKKEKGNGEEF